MIDSPVYVSEGSVVAFHEASIEFEDYPVCSGILDWDPIQQLLVVTTWAKAGAVHFRAENHDTPPPFDHGWSSVQEVSVHFEIGDVRLLDLEYAQGDVFPDVSLVPGPGYYRVRLYEVGQDAGVQYLEPGDELVERYLMQLWPEGGSHPAVERRRLT